MPQVVDHAKCSALFTALDQQCCRDADVAENFAIYQCSRRL